jgi:hypothetical protein
LEAILAGHGLRGWGMLVGNDLLTNLVHRTAELLEPVYEAHLHSILSSQVMAGDGRDADQGRPYGEVADRSRELVGYIWVIMCRQPETAIAE